LSERRLAAALTPPRKTGKTGTSDSRTILLQETLRAGLPAKKIVNEVKIPAFLPCAVNTHIIIPSES
jgi:hypothetical protein